MIDQSRVCAETFVRFVEHYPHIASTNDLAMRVARDPRTETPMLIIADEQTAGRGRGSNRWWSAKGALTFSLVFDTEDFRLPADRWSQVALSAALAVCETVSEHVPDGDCGVKWPNDVWLSGRKVCGILVEVPHSRPPVRLVVGLGLNLNNSMAGAPPDVQSRATSLTDILGKPLDPTEVLLTLLTRFETSLQELGSDGSSRTLAARWQERCLLRGKRVTIATPGAQVRGICHGIQPDGSLEVDVPGGRTKVYGGTVEAWE